MKKTLIASTILIFLCWCVLSVMGKRILPAAPLTRAWTIPFGASAYYQVVSAMIPSGSNRDEVEAILGEPNDEMISTSGDGRFSLVYIIPMVSSAEILILFDSDSQVLQTQLLK